MKARLKKTIFGGAALLALAMPFAARADSDGDHDLARQLYEQGQVRALGDIVRIAEERVAGDVVSVDLLRLNDEWVYRLQIVGPDGHRTTIDVDASGGSITNRRDKGTSKSLAVEGPALPAGPRMGPE